jgi:hypothetical protein
MKLRNLLTTGVAGVLLITLSTAHANQVIGVQPVIDEGSFSSITVNNNIPTANATFNFAYLQGTEAANGKVCDGPQLPTSINYICIKTSLPGLPAANINNDLAVFKNPPLSKANAVQVTQFAFHTNSCSVDLMQGAAFQKLAWGQAITIDTKTCAVS